MRNLFGDSGIFHLGWTIPYAFAVLILGVVFFRFVTKLSSNTRRLFIVAVLIYIGGALGLEVIESFHVAKHGWHNPIAVAMITLEDTMEMSGIALFLYALFSYVGHHLNGINLVLTD